MAIRLSTYYRADDVPVLPGTCVFYSTEFFRALEQTPGYRPILLVASEQGVPIGKLLCITRRHFRVIGVEKTFVYGGGEYFNTSRRSDEVFNEMLAYLTSIYKDTSFIIEFRNLEESLFAYRYFRQNGYFPVRWLRVRNSVHHGTADKWMSSSRRRQIQRGLKSGVVMDIARSEDEIHLFFAMLKKYYSAKILRYLPSVDFFLSLLAQNGEHEVAQIFLIRYKGKIIGGSLCLFSGSDAYLLFSGGMRKSYPRQYPGILAVWSAMTYAHKAGYEHFEFIDAGLPFEKYGFHDFILRFGGKQMSTRRWFRIKWKWLNDLLTRLYI